MTALPHMPPPSHRVPFGTIAIALYILSLFFPAVILSPHEHSVLGFKCLLFGWLMIPWYANVLVWVAAVGIALRRPTLAVASAALALLLALSTFGFLGTEIRSLLVGFFLWLASIGMTLVAAGVAARHHAVALAQARILERDHRALEDRDGAGVRRSTSAGTTTTKHGG